MYCKHAYKRQQIIMQRTSQPLVHTLKGICDDNIADYNYRYVFQAASNSTSDLELVDTFNPTTNVCTTFTGGDFICPFDDRNRHFNNICSQYKVYKPNTCAYEPDITTSAACPPQCRINNSVSIISGICDYGNTFKFTRCFYSNIQIDSKIDIQYLPTKQASNSPIKQPTQFSTNNPILASYIIWIDNNLLNQIIFIQLN